MKKSIFPDPVLKLPEADIPLDGVRAFLSQSTGHQILFMEFEQDVELPEHAHEGQIGFVLDGRIDMVIDGEPKSFGKGDMYYIPRNTPHSGFIHAGYADITFFDQEDRYGPKG